VYSISSVANVPAIDVITGISFTAWITIEIEAVDEYSPSLTINSKLSVPLTFS
jgi:hypothetical protein